MKTSSAVSYLKGDFLKVSWPVNILFLQWLLVSIAFFMRKKNGNIQTSGEWRKAIFFYLFEIATALPVVFLRLSVTEQF